jgi:hypothetical protein
MIHGYFSDHVHSTRAHSLLSYWMRLRNQDASASVVGIHELDNHDTSYVHPTFIFPLTAHTHTFDHSIILCVCLEWTRVAHNTTDAPTPHALNMSVVLVDRYKRKKLQSQRDIRVICKVTLSFTPYPLFQWYPQSNEIFLLNLGMKC